MVRLDKMAVYHLAFRRETSCPSWFKRREFFMA